MCQRHGTETEPVGYATWSVLKTHLTINRYPDSRYLEYYWEITRSPTGCSPGSSMIMWGFLNHRDVPRIFQRASHQVITLANTMCAVRASGSVCKNSLDAKDYPDVCFGPKRGNDFSLWWFPLDHLGTRGNFHSNNKKTHPSKQAMNLYYRSFGNHPNRVKLI